MSIPVLVGAPPAKNSITYRGLNINNAADDEADTYIIEDISESPTWQQNLEPFPDRDGSQTYQPFDLFKMFRVRGWARATSLRKLYDSISAINQKFHPVLAYNADTSTFNKGYLPLTFNVPTNDTANYATGLIACQYYVQAQRPPIAQDTKFNGLNARIDFLLRAADPRRYQQTTSSANRTGNGTITCVNTLATYPSYPVITIVTSVTAPSGSLTLTRTSPAASGAVTITGSQITTSKTYVLDMQARTFVNGAIDKIAAIAGGSQFFDLSEGVSNTVTVAGFPADATITVTWLRAFV